MRKGQAEITEILSLVAIAVALIFFFVVILPKFMGSMFGMFALNSADAVSRDIAGLTTISGAATDRMTITYAPVSSYDVKILDRVVYVTLLEGLQDSATARMGVPATCDGNCEFASVNSFEISKTTSGEQNSYEVSADAV
jgi:hypothetical protein